MCFTVNIPTKLKNNKKPRYIKNPYEEEKEEPTGCTELHKAQKCPNFFEFRCLCLNIFSIESESYLLFLSIFSNLSGEAFGSQGDVVSMVAAAACSSSSSSSTFFFFFVLYETTQVYLLFFSFWVCQPTILPLN